MQETFTRTFSGDVCSIPWYSDGNPILAIDVTGHCNLRCIHCYNAEFLPSQLTREDLTHLLTTTPRNWKVYFLGGEPFVRKDMLSILTESVDLGHPTSFCTNGTLVRRIGPSKILDTGATEIYVSLDGADAETNDSIRGKGSFEAAIDGLMAFEEAGKTRHLSLNLSVTACGTNIESISMIPELLDSLGVHIDKLGIMPMSPIGRGAKYPELKINELAWLDLCETLCAKWHNFPRLIFLCIANPELAIRYLEARYNIYLNDSVADCRVVRKTDACRVLADGRVAPCSGRLDLVERMCKEGELDLIAPEELHISGQEVPFEGFISSMQPFLKLDDAMCEACPYQLQCQICPLEVYYNTEPRMSRQVLCKEVWSRVHQHDINLNTENSTPDPLIFPKNYNKELYIDPTIYTRELRDGRMLIICPRDQSYHLLDNAGTSFWKTLVTDKDFPRSCQKYLASHQDTVVGIQRFNYLLRTLEDANAIAY